jgi:hypothetical protein
VSVPTAADGCSTVTPPHDTTEAQGSSKIAMRLKIRARGAFVTILITRRKCAPGHVEVVESSGAVGVSIDRRRTCLSSSQAAICDLLPWTDEIIDKV